MKRERRRARSLALQILYEVDCVGHPLEEVLAGRLERSSDLEEETAAFLRQMVLGAFEHAEELDAMIASCAPDWPVDELAILDRNILRLALWEIKIYTKTPVKVAINEAVELAKRFSSDNAPRFINGVLGTLIREDEES
ncbi:MAG: transcription antitermination factor NusB [Anaerolineales bacterium]